MGRSRFSADSTMVIFDVATSSTSLRTIYQVKTDGTSLAKVNMATGSAVNNYVADTH